MSKRTIISIDEEKCNGCGLCIPNCPEGAMQLIDGKARLISDLFCDGLGACVGYCPEGAITIQQGWLPRLTNRSKGHSKSEARNSKSETDPND